MFAVVLHKSRVSESFIGAAIMIAWHKLATKYYSNVSYKKKKTWAHQALIAQTIHMDRTRLIEPEVRFD